MTVVSRINDFNLVDFGYSIVMEDKTGVDISNLDLEFVIQDNDSIDIIRQFIDDIKHNRDRKYKHLIFHGPERSGKTHLIEKIDKIINMHRLPPNIELYRRAECKELKAAVQSNIIYIQINTDDTSNCRAIHRILSSRYGHLETYCWTIDDWVWTDINCSLIIEARDNLIHNDSYLGQIIREKNVVSIKFPRSISRDQFITCFSSKVLLPIATMIGFMLIS